jgi:hypothetical protein
MAPQQITLFLSRERAERIARQSIKSSERFHVQHGVTRWHDGTVDHGYRVKIIDGNHERYL